jgi:hypothetical protein
LSDAGPGVTLPRVRFRDRVKALASSLWRIGERCGVHVLPVHFYSSQPNIHALEQTRAVWAKPSALPGIDADADRQVEALRGICTPYRHEYQEARSFTWATEKGFGRGYGPIEAQALHAFVRHAKPARLLEVGSGVSTYCAYVAAELNRRDGAPCAITCIEPYPRAPLRELPVTLIDRPVQTVPIATFTALRENDILFIDSTHAVRAGGDVNFLVLEVLPRLAPGVLVHVHDIYLPYDYSPQELDVVWFHWSETSLIRALLTDNPRLQIVAALSQLHHERPAALRELFPDYTPRPMTDGLFPRGSDPALHFPSSLWLRVTPIPGTRLAQ